MSWGSKNVGFSFFSAKQSQRLYCAAKFGFRYTNVKISVSAFSPTKSKKGSLLSSSLSKMKAKQEYQKFVPKKN